MGLANARNRGAGAVEEGGIVKRRGGKQMFKVGGVRRIEMRPAPIQKQANGRLASGATGKQRPQEGIFDKKALGLIARGHGRAAPSGWALAPDGDAIVAFGPSETQIIPGKREHAPQAFLQEKAAIKGIKPPAHGRVGSFIGLPRGAHHWPLSVEAAPTVEDSVPVTAEMVLFHVVIGASVT